LLGPCVATQFHRFAMGRIEQPEDEAALAAFKQDFEASGYEFHELLLAYVTSNAFGYRREED
jgi:hypothetical protein